jgi:predicted metal-dependent hydrolase
MADRINWNNTPLSPEVARRFLDSIDMADTTVTFSKRKTKRRWGTAWKKTNRITLYRHSVWMFLHELAHIKAPVKSGHGREFAQALDDLFAAWQKAFTNL